MASETNGESRTPMERVCDFFSKHFGIGYYERHSEAPPRLRLPHVAIASLVTLGGIGLSVYQIGAGNPWSETALYLSLAAFLIGVVVLRAQYHGFILRKVRSVGAAQVGSLMSEADGVEPRLTEPVERPENFERKREVLDAEVKRLKKLGPLEWTEWQVLNLSVLLIDFLSIDDLINRARLYLTALQEYADDASYPYERAQYEQRRFSVEHGIQRIHDQRLIHADDAVLIDDAAEVLRSELRGLAEYIVDYEESWARGTVLLSGLRFCCSVSIPVLLLMGLLPITRGLIDSPSPLGWFNYAFLGSAGAIITVLLNFIRSNEVEVGHAHGRREVSRALVAVVIGFFSGVAIYAFMGSGLGSLIFVPALVPDVEDTAVGQVLLSVFWAMLAGLFFEWVVERIRKGV